MSISEQVKELRNKADIYNTVGSVWELNRAEARILQGLLRKAADTIESLSAKLQAGNMERSAEDCGKSVLKIDTPKVCIDCPCHFAGESGMVVCGVEKKNFYRTILRHLSLIGVR